eukprot:gene1983-3023_t
MSDGTMNTEVPISSDGVVYHINARSADIADNILLVGDPGRVPFVASMFDKGSVRFEGMNREIRTMTGTYQGLPVTAMSTGMGTDNVEIVMTEIHILKEFNVGTKKWSTTPPQVNVIRCGTCGCPQADVDVGSLAITFGGIGLDNTGKYYQDSLLRGLPNDATLKELRDSINKTELKEVQPYLNLAHPTVSGTLNSLAQQRKRKAVLGFTASAPGFYASQGRRVGRLSAIRYDVPAALQKVRGGGKRVVNIEMECSALCHLGHMLGYRCGAVCVVLANRY